MKYLLFVVFSIAQLVFAAAPNCVNIGTKSEGWQTPNGQVVFDRCEYKAAVCGAIGTRSEGWYVVDLKQGQLMGWANCSQDKSTEPKCINIGTRSEGWLLPNGKLAFDNCSEKYVRCGAKGTRSEGWYIYAADLSIGQLLGWANCSK